MIAYAIVADINKTHIDSWTSNVPPDVATGQITGLGRWLPSSLVPGFADPADLTFGAGALQVHVGRFGLAGGVRRGPED